MLAYDDDLYQLDEVFHGLRIALKMRFVEAKIEQRKCLSRLSHRSREDPDAKYAGA